MKYPPCRFNFDRREAYHLPATEDSMFHSSYPGQQLSELNDEELLSQFRQGVAPAFEELYKRFWGVLYYQAYRMLEHEQDAQDVVQEIFTTIWTKAGGIELSGPLAA